MSENFPKIIFVTGIGTDVGKSWATGWLAREIADAGHSVITHKFIQTGCHEFSEDIDTHRRIMGIAMQSRDLDHTTAPLILSYPASPQLSASIDGVTVDYDITIKAIHQLSEEYDTVISEGAGGLMVPLNDDMLTLDLLREHPEFSAAVVVSGYLGSINHALLTLEALRREGVKVWAVIYNPHFDNDAIIAADTKNYLQNYVSVTHPGTLWIQMPEKII